MLVIKYYHNAFKNDPAPTHCSASTVDIRYGFFLIKSAFLIAFRSHKGFLSHKWTCPSKGVTKILQKGTIWKIPIPWNWTILPDLKESVAFPKPLIEKFLHTSIFLSYKILCIVFDMYSAPYKRITSSTFILHDFFRSNLCSLLLFAHATDFCCDENSTKGDHLRYSLFYFIIWRNTAITYLIWKYPLPKKSERLLFHEIGQFYLFWNNPLHFRNHLLKNMMK
jgi:hypothetical protein